MFIHLHISQLLSISLKVWVVSLSSGPWLPAPALASFQADPLSDGLSLQWGLSGREEGVGGKAFCLLGSGAPPGLCTPLLPQTVLEDGSTCFAKRKEGRGRKGAPVSDVATAAVKQQTFLRGHCHVFRVKEREKCGHRHVRSSLGPYVCS